MASTALPTTSCSGEEKELSYHVLLEAGSNIHEEALKGIWKTAVSLVNDSTLTAPVPAAA